MPQTILGFRVRPQGLGLTLRICRNQDPEPGVFGSTVVIAEDPSAK